MIGLASQDANSSFGGNTDGDSVEKKQKKEEKQKKKEKKEKKENVGTEEAHTDLESGTKGSNGEQESGSASPTASGKDKEETVEVELTSTNDLSFPTFPPFLQLLSLFVQGVQIAILVTLITENNTKIPPFQSTQFRIGQIFVFFYTLGTTISGLSALQKAAMAQLNTETQGEDSFSKKAFNSLSEQKCGVGCMMVGGGVLCGVLSLLIALLFFITQLFDGVSPVMNEEAARAPFLRRFLRILSFLAECTVTVTTLVAVIVVTNQQPNLLNILFNFTGVQVVSQLDEVLIGFLPASPVHVVRAKGYDEASKGYDLKPEILDISVQFGFTVAAGIVLGFSLFDTVDWPTKNDSH